MSETDSFIQEVTEEVRQDRMFRLWKKYAPLVISGVAAIVAAAGGWSWYQHYKVQQARQTGEAFLAASLDKPAEEESLVARIDGPAKVLAGLRLAAAKAKAGDAAGAAEEYRKVAAEPGLSPAYADLAKLEAVRVSMATADPKEAVAALDPLTQPNAPYRLLALELRAAVQMNAGNAEAAQKDLTAILLDDAATRSLRERATVMMLASGGILPEAPAADGQKTVTQ